MDLILLTIHHQMASLSHPNPVKFEIIKGGNNAWSPEGYVVVRGPSNQNYVVPEFMVPALHQTYDGDQIKNDLNVLTASGSVSAVCNISDNRHLQ